jgi:hypothetical protein
MEVENCVKNWKKKIARFSRPVFFSENRSLSLHPSSLLNLEMWIPFPLSSLHDVSDWSKQRS